MRAERANGASFADSLVFENRFDEKGAERDPLYDMLYIHVMQNIFCLIPKNRLDACRSAHCSVSVAALTHSPCQAADLPQKSESILDE